MQKLKEELIEEFKNNLSFWIDYAIDKSTNHIFFEVSTEGVPNLNAPLGVMYLSRILYGASTAYQFFRNDIYRELADRSYTQLKEFSNEKGGYYWAKTASSSFIHDADNTNMAQAFVLYGMIAYAQINSSSFLENDIDNQVAFIVNYLYDKENGGYIDGFDENWILGENPTKALGTHLHLLEAFVKLFEYRKSQNLIPKIEALIRIIIAHFITKDTYDCVHRLTPDWKPLPNEIWAGHNAECSWILCNAAKVIQNEKLLNECEELSLKMMKRLIDNAFDENNGVFNVLQNNVPIENVKVWWVQAETVLGLLNCYEISKDISYQNKAIELINFISNNFIGQKGEWYTEIDIHNKPINAIPMIHFWKSMYHTIRYYAQLTEKIERI
jgi:mannobiose 2-epimerase